MQWLIQRLAAAIVAEDSYYIYSKLLNKYGTH